ncbi:MAG TPA: hypothetical protein VFD74_07440 [Thermoleophilia bacterium]|nr:hypothetical protein [Thermoleophilia bacterium]
MTFGVKTIPVRVKVYTDDYVVTGLIHTKPGGYKERVSDIVNDPAARFLVITDATFSSAKQASSSAKHCEALVLRVDDIKLLIPFEREPEARPSGEVGEAQSW